MEMDLAKHIRDRIDASGPREKNELLETAAEEIQRDCERLAAQRRIRMTTQASSASPLDIPVMPCPFCGKTETLEVITGAEFMDEDQEFYQHSESFAVVCNAATPNGKGGCGAMGGFADTRKTAIDRWNTRHNA